ncbi:MAG: outer membrane protein transport protein [Candidatus Cloacimonetes bacterium]|nr:outer membrane protein transport protein [Candidatus Cloacimonadota bacterium]
MKKIILLIITLSISSSLMAGGFQINEHGAKAMAMGGAFTGLADDPSAVYFNPAGITQLDGTQIMTGLTLILPSASFRGPSPEITEYDMKKQVFNPINFYLTHKFNEKLYAGISVNNPYGLGTEWEEDWIGKYLAGKTEVTTFFITPVIAYKLMDNLSLSAGPTYAFGDVAISKKEGLFDASINLEGKANSAWGFSAGALYEPIKNKLSFGLSFKSETKFEFEGNVTSEGSPVVEPALPTGNISADLTTPMNLTFGVAYKLNPKLTLAADYQYIGWSCYDTLAVEFAENDEWNISAPRNYQDTYILRFGCEYKLNEKINLRTGILFDNNPVEDEWVEPSLPDADRIGFSSGLSYKLKDFSIDLAYLFLRFSEREITTSEILNGVYNSTANLIGINLSYKF